MSHENYNDFLHLVTIFDVVMLVGMVVTFLATMEPR